MSIFGSLFGSPKKEDGFTQPEREALLDLLLLCTYADNHLSLIEQHRIDQKIASFTWEGPTAVEIYVAESTASVRNALADPHTLDAFLHDIAARLSSGKSKQRAIEAMNSLFSADGLEASETEFSHKVQGILRA